MSRFVVVAFLLLAASASAQPDGGTIRSIGVGPAGPPLDRIVEEVAVQPSGEVWASGLFEIFFPENPVRNVARWTGARWVPGGSFDGTVEVIAATPTGAVYAGGLFITVDGENAAGVARYLEDAWTSLGTGVTGPVNGRAAVYAIAEAPDGTVAVGGGLTAAGGTPANNIALWTGTAWQALGDGLSGAVRALAFGPDGTLYAGGDDFGTGGATLTGVVRWDGSGWQRVGTLDGSVDEILTHGGRLVVRQGDRVVEWQDGAWQPLGTDTVLRAITFAPDGSLWGSGLDPDLGVAGGSFLWSWSGSAWQSETPPLFPSGTRALAAAPDGSLVVGGDFDAAGDRAAESVARWTGVGWESFGSRIDDEITAVAPKPGGGFYIGGPFSTETARLVVTR